MVLERDMVLELVGLSPLQALMVSIVLGVKTTKEHGPWILCADLREGTSCAYFQGGPKHE